MTDRQPIGGIHIDPATIFRPNLAAEIDDTRTWVTPDGYRLSDRLWLAKAADRAQIDAILRRGLANGQSPLVTARELHGMLNPDKQLRRDPDTYQVLPINKQPPGVATLMPRQGPGAGPTRPRNSGVGSYAARRLARTETTRAFGAATLRAAEANPLIRCLRWRLSGAHHDSDQCDQNAARHSNNRPPGVYLIGELPRYPDHPHEMCSLGPYASDEDIADGMRRLQRAMKDGRFDPASIEREFARRGRPPGSKNKPKTGEPVNSRPLAWQDEISAIRNSRTSDPDEIIRAGRVIKDQILRGMSPERRRAWGVINDAELAKRRRAIADDYWDADLRAKRRADGSDAEFDAIYRDYMRESREAEDIFKAKPFVTDVVKTLRKVRSMGSTRSHAHTALKRDVDLTENYGNTTMAIAQQWSDTRAIAALDAIKRDMPTDWWDASVNRTLGDDLPVSLQVVKRGFYSDSRDSRLRGHEIDNKFFTSGDTPSELRETMVHEFMHRTERTTAGIVDAERAYYQRRTAGEELQEMPGYAPNEKSRPDAFKSAYTGKEYDNSYEMLTMGATDVLKRKGVPKLFVEDEEYLDWTLGMLAVK